MNHHKSIRKFGRVRKVRNALLKSLALSLMMHGKIKTTEAKARELRSYAEKMVTQGKNPTLSARRALIAKIGVEGADQVISKVAPKFADRKGGYTRITKLPARKSDGGLMAVIEFV
ncbi:MAG: 50S ribosomal protein L17 [bacterium]